MEDCVVEKLEKIDDNTSHIMEKDTKVIESFIGLKRQFGFMAYIQQKKPGYNKQLKIVHWPMTKTQWTVTITNIQRRLH